MDTAKDEQEESERLLIFTMQIFSLCALVLWFICAASLYWQQRKLKKYRRKDDKFLELELEEDGDAQYLVSIFTGSYKNPPSGRVHLHLLGSLYPGKFHMLCNSTDADEAESIPHLFPPFCREKFIISEDVYLGKILSVVLATEVVGNHPHWECKSVIVRDLRTNEAWYFRAKCKIGFPPKTMLAATEEELTSFRVSWFRRVRREVRQGQYVYFGFWFRSTKSVYTYLQRHITAVTCLINLLSLCLLAFGIILPRYESDNEQESKSSTKHTESEILREAATEYWLSYALIIGLVASIVASLVGFLLVTLFREKSKYETKFEEMDYVIGTALHEHDRLKERHLMRDCKHYDPVLKRCDSTLSTDSDSESDNGGSRRLTILEGPVPDIVVTKPSTLNLAVSQEITEVEFAPPIQGSSWNHILKVLDVRNILKKKVKFTRSKSGTSTTNKSKFDTKKNFTILLPAPEPPEPPERDKPTGWTAKLDPLNWSNLNPFAKNRRKSEVEPEKSSVDDTANTAATFKNQVFSKVSDLFSRIKTNKVTPSMESPKVVQEVRTVQEMEVENILTEATERVEVEHILTEAIQRVEVEDILNEAITKVNVIPEVDNATNHRELDDHFGNIEFSSSMDFLSVNQKNEDASLTSHSSSRSATSRHSSAANTLVIKRKSTLTERAVQEKREHMRRLFLGKRTHDDRITRASGASHVISLPLTSDVLRQFQGKKRKPSVRLSRSEYTEKYTLNASKSVFGIGRRKCRKPIRAWVAIVVVNCASICMSVVTLGLIEGRLTVKPELYFYMILSTFLTALIMGTIFIETAKMGLIGAYYAYKDKTIYKKIIKEAKRRRSRSLYGKHKHHLKRVSTKITPV